RARPAGRVAEVRPAGRRQTVLVVCQCRLLIRVQPITPRRYLVSVVHDCRLPVRFEIDHARRQETVPMPFRVSSANGRNPSVVGPAPSRQPAGTQIYWQMFTLLARVRPAALPRGRPPRPPAADHLPTR